MACRTASVERVADKSVTAQQQLDKLTDSVKAREEELTKEFNSRVDKDLLDARVDDATLLGKNSYIKVEYSYEFSLDKIASVIKDTLKAVAANKDTKTFQQAFSDEAIKSYTDLVNSVSEAAKSKSTAAASISFSMNRLAPGIFAFLSATTASLQEEETFGSESVTSTVIFYRLVYSIQDLKNQGNFDEAAIDVQNLLNMKRVQAALTDSLAEGKITIDDWMARDEKLNGAVERLRARLEERGFGDRTTLVASRGMSENQRLVTQALERLTKMGAAYFPAVSILESRLEMSYFN
ncbi:hypothetical protein FUA48_10950 [Flavobacterium alkalisoli]|uniref:Uncharacterized protein n=1 Tax=Flavobacterium alkalisoli TaxID=2602769 RepID=A0A5B9FZ97_9FLAO|nr:hypothetical protein [Flavobacterium alkalisoli]QEE50077.1 hypothetical protein FUA48_10950 [Flavobacterium alkalisoli]